MRAVRRLQLEITLDSIKRSLISTKLKIQEGVSVVTRSTTEDMADLIGNHYEREIGPSSYLYRRAQLEGPGEDRRDLRKAQEPEASDRQCSGQGFTSSRPRCHHQRRER